jgi:hypothetical protein
VGVARSSRQPWAEHKRISPAARRRAPRALGEARRRGHQAPARHRAPSFGPAPCRPVAGRRSPPPRALLRVRSRQNASHVPPPRPILRATCHRNAAAAVGDGESSWAAENEAIPIPFHCFHLFVFNVANVCFRCFQRSRAMSKTFHVDVAK